MTTTRASKALWSALNQMIHQKATYVGVMSTTQVATVNNLSIKRALHHGGDHLSVDLATVPRIEALTQAVTSSPDSAVAGFVTKFLGVTYC